MSGSSRSSAQLLSLPLACLGGLIAVWSLELYWVQATTLVGAQSGGADFNYFAPKIRLLLDGLGISVLCLTFRSWRLVPWLVFSLLVYLLLLTYTNYFQRPLSLMTVASSWREGMKFSGLVLNWIPLRAMCVLLALFIIKLLLLWQTRTLAIPVRLHRLALTATLCGYVTLYATTLWLDPLDGILRTKGVARLGIIRGYVGPWLAEWYYSGDERLLANAIARTEVTSDLLTPAETPIPIKDKLAIVQVESLDYRVIDFEYKGQPVTPFLNQLKKRSLFYRAKCYHVIGSADADFTMLVGAPALNVLNYSLPKHPYDMALPWLLQRYGYRSNALHGNTGNFYTRRNAFEKMGFDKLYFREELQTHGGFQIDRLGLRDRDVLNFSAAELQNATSPTCHFLITLTSHSPYSFLGPEEELLIPNPKTVIERYFNHIYYVDQCLKDYIGQLGRGATVVIYSDHATEVQGDGFKNSRESDGEYVPVFIYDTDQDLAALQRTRSTSALAGELKMLDISSYLRNQVKVTHSAQEVTAASASRPTATPENNKPASVGAP